MKHLYSAGIVTYIREEHPTSPHLAHKVSESTARLRRTSEILYLLLRYGAGHWDFPKGKIEKGETKQEAALRELMEETGLTAKIDTGFEETFEYIFTDYDKQLAKKTVYFFIGEAHSTKIKLSFEHTDYQWLQYEKAIEQLTYDNAKVLLKKAHKYIVNLQKSL